MYKKLMAICLMLCISLSLSTSVTVKAAENNISSEKQIIDMFNKAVTQDQASDLYATLTSASGTRYRVKMFKLTEPTLSSKTTNEITQTFVVSTDEQYMEPVNELTSPLDLEADEQFMKPVNDLTSTFDLPANDQNLKNDLISPLAQTKDEWDDSISVHAFLTLTYTRSGNKVLLTKVNGNWAISDNTVSLSNREVIYTCQDPISMNQYVWTSTSLNTFNYNTGFTHYVEETNDLVIVGASANVVLTHGSSKWDLQITNTLVDNGWVPSF